MYACCINKKEIMSQYVIDYAIVDNDGRILMFGKSLTRPTQEGFQTLDTAPPDIDHYWSGVGWVAIPTSPSPEHIFDYTTKQWVDPRTLDDHKSAKWKEIKRQRDVAEFATFTYNNMEFDGDLDAQRRLTAYISVSKSSIAAGQPFEAEFTLANNTNVTLTAQDFVGIELAKVQAVAATFNHASALRDQIDAATTVQEVEAITW